MAASSQPEASKDEASRAEAKWSRALSPRPRARLTPIRDLEPTPPPNKPGEIRAPNKSRTTFSRSCNHVGKDQQDMSIFDVRKIYSNCELFSNCSAEFVRSLLSEGGPEATQGAIYDPNVVIVEQGTIGHAMYIIHRGEAEVLLNGTAVTKLSGGAHFGEMQLLGLTPMRTATIRSLTICHIFEVKSEVFVRLLLRFRHERHLFEQEAMKRYRDLAEVRRKQKRRLQHLEQVFGGVLPPDTSTKGSSIKGEVRVSITEEMTASLEAAAKGDSSALRSLRKQQTASWTECRTGTASTTASQSAPTTASTNAEHMGKRQVASAGEFSPKSAEPDSPRSTASCQGQRTAVLRSNPKSARKSAQVESETGFGGDGRFLFDESFNSDAGPKPMVEEEGFMQRITRSLRTDMKRGFMAASSSWAPPVGSTFRDVSVEEEHLDPDTAQLLETKLLPPLSLLSPAQKQGLLKQLRQQARLKLRRGVNKLSVNRVLYKLRTNESP